MAESLAEKLKRAVLEELSQKGAFCSEQQHEKLLEEIPSKWVDYGGVILFRMQAFYTWSVWSCYPGVFEIIAKIFNARMLVKTTGSILNDGYRTPQTQILYGTDPWAVKKENGILYTWDVTKVMFCKGNFSEKQRISNFNCEGQTVVDLYAGIGYFVLPYLIHAKAELVYAFEWNPPAALALKRSLELNKVQDKCVIMEVDNLNSMTLVKNVADHVNLGMIPSSESTWQCGCAILKKEVGGILHIHANVDVMSSFTTSADFGGGQSVPVDWIQWSHKCCESLNSIFQEMYPEESWNVKVIGMFKVKSYAPHVDHVVFDVECRPAKYYSMSVGDAGATTTAAL